MDGVTTHTITFKGFSGATFVLVMMALVFYVLAFGSGAWAGVKTDAGGYAGTGLWSACGSIPDDYPVEGKLNFIISTKHRIAMLRVC